LTLDGPGQQQILALLLWNHLRGRKLSSMPMAYMGRLSTEVQTLWSMCSKDVVG
jgi:hypothetical protein